MDTLPLSARPNLADYTERAEQLVEAAKSEESNAVHDRCGEWLDEIVRLSGPDLTDFVRGSYERSIGEVKKAAREASTKEGEDGPGFALADAQFLIARAHSFESWNAFAAHVDLASRETPDGAEFEVAADAVVGGNLPKLKSLLRRNPALAQGADVDRPGAWDMTGLMWAACQGHLDTMNMILDHGPSLELRNEFGGTAMGTALHFAINAPNPGRRSSLPAGSAGRMLPNICWRRGPTWMGGAPGI